MFSNAQADVVVAFGGIGLFLLGMIVLTDGLRGLAGPALRRLLVRFTNTPLRGAALGAFTTAIIQSSSATTVTAVGFVGAGLLTFPQGLGIVFGANIGTTITGWLVAILGFKLKLGQIALALVFVGVLLRMFASGRLRLAGWALIGFGLLFVGIDAMQHGMAQFRESVTPDTFPGDTWLGRIQLVLLGIVFTVITQSSSAGVAAALVALSVGTISFPQAAAMVIGMDVGTTFTTALATVGGSTAMRQTGYAHVIYNVLTGIMAFVLLEPYTAAIEMWAPTGNAGNAQISLVGFHTLFNTLGVVLVLPFAGAFSRLITVLVREREPVLLHRLDKRLLHDPAAAVDSLTATVEDIANALLKLLGEQLQAGWQVQAGEHRLRSINAALRTCRDYLEQIHTERTDPQAHNRHLACMHTLDHINRLAHRCGQGQRIAQLAADQRLRRLSGLLRTTAATVLVKAKWSAAERRLNRLLGLLERQHHLYRKRTIENAARQKLDTQDTITRLDSIRWLHRVAHHLWRIVHHLRRAAEETDSIVEPFDMHSDLDVD